MISLRLPHLLLVGYIVALGVIASAMVIGSSLTRDALGIQANDSEAINVAGRQRMLSQRIAMHAIALLHSDTPDRHRGSLLESLDQFEASHRELTGHRFRLGLTESYTGVAGSEPARRFNGEIAEFVRVGRTLVESQDRAKQHEAALAIGSHSESLLPKLDDAVRRMERASQHSIMDTERGVVHLLWTKLGLLFTVAALVFLPLWFIVVRSLRRRDEARDAIQKNLDERELEIELRTIVLAERTGLLTSIVDNAPCAIFWKDRDGIVRGCNRVFARALGFANPSDIIDKTDSELGIPDSESEQFRACDLRVMSTREPLIDHEECLSVDGEIKWLRTSKVPLENDRGEVTGLLGVFTDVTEIKTALGEVRSASDRLALGLEIARGGEWDWDIKTGDVAFSGRWLSLFGYGDRPGTRTIGDFGELVHPEDRASVWANVDRHMNGEADYYHCEYRVRAADGSYVWTIAYGKIVEHDANGQALRMQGLNIDTTREHEQREILADALRHAESASRAKSEFLATMSHELRTPLNGVIGMTELLIDTDLDERQREFASACHASGRTLLAIINDILDLSKIEAGRLELDSEAFDVERCLEDTVAEFATQAHEKDIELVTSLSPATRRIARGDAGRLRQIVMNLVGNAIKFTESGTIRVSAEVAEETDDAMTLKCIVRDTGIGIPEEKLTSLFSPFTQADSSMNRRFGGSGLGLAICKQLAEAMGGSVGVESEIDVGSSFWFTVTLAREQAGERVGHINLCVPERVLLISGPDQTSDAIETMLTSWGIGVESIRVENREDSMREVLASHRVDRSLIILDIPADPNRRNMMIDGLQALHPMHGVVACLPSMLDRKEIAETIGVERFLSKPVGASALLDAISDLCRGAEPVSSIGSDRSNPAVSDPEPLRRALTILVAEDNATNQLYIRELLERAGHRCVVASDGHAVLDSLGSEPFDLVFMDCQMPAMDGFEATRAIRASEGRRGDGSRIPIIALTANAIKGDRERCLEAGMDDYLSKPVDAATVLDKIAKFTGNVVAAADATQPQRGADQNLEAEMAPPIDVDSALHRCMDDPEFLIMTLNTFSEQIPELRSALGNATKSGDHQAAARAAHAIKGAAGAISAQELADLAASAERDANSEGAEALAILLPEIDEAFRRCESHIKRIREQFGTSFNDTEREAA